MQLNAELDLVSTFFSITRDTNAKSGPTRTVGCLIAKHFAQFPAVIFAASTSICETNSFNRSTTACTVSRLVKSTPAFCS